MTKEMTNLEYIKSLDAAGLAKYLDNFYLGLNVCDEVPECSGACEQCIRNFLEAPHAAN